MPEQSEQYGQAGPREHYYHAEASVLSGNLVLPVKQEIHPQAFAKLPETGGYLSQEAGPFKVEGVLSYKKAHTQVGGNLETKPGHGFSTIVTSVVEGLNVLDVITADRVVGQISTEHPLVGYVPHVTFLGTKFENLRINGHPVKLDLDLDLFAHKPVGNVPHSENPALIEKVERQHVRLRADDSLTAEESKRYNPPSHSSGRTIRASTGVGDTEKVECSLVNQVEGSYPGRSFGHVIRIPDFGTVILGHLELEESEFHNGVPLRTLFHLTMVDIRMGCIATGTAKVAKAVSNGGGKPHTPPPPGNSSS